MYGRFTALLSPKFIAILIAITCVSVASFAAGQADIIFDKEFLTYISHILNDSYE